VSRRDLSLPMGLFRINVAFGVHVYPVTHM